MLEAGVGNLPALRLGALGFADRAALTIYTFSVCVSLVCV